MNNNNIIIKIDNNTQNTSNDDFNYDRFTQEDKNNKITIENNCISKNIQKVEKKKKQIFSFKNNIKLGKIIKSILRDGFFKFYIYIITMRPFLSFKLSRKLAWSKKRMSYM